MIRRHLRWIALLISFSAFLAVLPAVAFGQTPPKWVPVPLRNWAFDVRLAIAPSVKKVSSLAQGSNWDDRVYIDNLGHNVRFQSQGLTMVGTLYKPEREGKRPGILLLHGSTPEGRKLGLYRMLGGELTDRGYVVLSIDLRGFGESEDPPRLDLPTGFDYIGDAKSAVSYLNSLAGVDSERLYIVSHSFGGSVAIASGIEDPRIHKIVAIGPSRRVKERIGTEEAPEWAYYQRRMMRYMGLSQPISAQVFLHLFDSLPIENHLEYFSQPDHKPILLIDGMLESEEDHLFLQQIHDSIVEPKKYITLPEADHYANVANFGPVVAFDQRAVEKLVYEIDLWLSSD